MFYCIQAFEKPVQEGMRFVAISIINTHDKTQIKDFFFTRLSLFFFCFFFVLFFQILFFFSVFRPLDGSAVKNYSSYFLTKTYVVGTQKNRLNKINDNFKLKKFA